MRGTRQRQIPEHPVIADMERYGYVRGYPGSRAFGTPRVFAMTGASKIQGAAHSRMSVPER